jgi:hypothetical protein
MEMLTIDDATWQALIAETRAAIDRYNAKATGNYANYSFECTVDGNSDTDWLETRQRNTSGPGDRRTIARIKATGELLKVTFKRKGKQIVSTGRSVTARSWIKAAAKSPAELLKATKLTDFMMIHIGEAYVAGHSTMGPEGIRHYDRDGKEKIVRKGAGHE